MSKKWKIGLAIAGVALALILVLRYVFFSGDDNKRVFQN